jgi:formate-dependent nitrite reductase membrane component NrfD
MANLQTGRQWMVTHEWMVEGNRQSEWIDKRGILLWLAFYLGGLGGGTYIVSLFFNSLWGMAIGWLIAFALKGVFHLVFLGKPIRFWRLLMHPQTSWLSRGLFFVFGFGGFAFFQIVIQYLAPEQTTAIMILKIIAGIFALCEATYTGFVLNNVKGVPFWELPILPLLFVACGFLGGFGMIVAIAQFSSAINLAAAEMGSRILLLINVFLIAIYLVWAARKEITGKRSVLYQLTGGISPIFWSCVVLLGIIIPASIAVYSIFGGEAISAVLLAGTVCEIIGGMMLRFCVLKSGIYNPIIAR